jgi:signal transduction histidine kinase/ActR/RegA family two-component response regulator
MEGSRDVASVARLRPVFIVLVVCVISIALCLCGGFLSVRLLPDQLWVADLAFSACLVLSFLAMIPMAIMSHTLWRGRVPDAVRPVLAESAAAAPGSGAAEHAALIGPIAEARHRDPGEFDPDLLREILDQLPYPLFAIDTGGQVLFMNEALASICGANTQRLSRRAADGTLRQLKIEDVLAQTAATQHGEEWVTSVDGEDRCYLIHRVPFQGTTTGELVVAVEATALHKLQHQLQFSQRLEVLGTLAGGIAHDFNNLLTPIVGYASILEAAALPQKHHSQVRAIANAADRAKSVAQQMLSFSRRSDEPLLHEQVDLGVILGEAINFMRASVPPSVDIQLDVKAPCWVNADSGELHQVLVNLCTNAAQSIHAPSGVVLVSCDLVAAGTAELPAELSAMDCARVQVIDDGRGMSQAVLSHIFEPFYTTKEVGEGSGLGLSVVKSILARHGGAITVQSSPGMGTCFNIYLPQAIGVIGAPAMGRGRTRLLLVDDDAMVLRVLEDLLETKGFTVTAFNDPRLALDFLSQAPELIDVVITDNNMPKLKGVDLARCAREAKPDVPVILITGFARPTDEELRHISRSLLKPVSAKDLTDAIRAVTTATQAA